MEIIKDSLSLLRRQDPSQESAALLQYHDETILARLPGAPAAGASCDNDEIKDAVFNAMPETWRDGCDLQFDLEDADLDSLITCMEK